MHSATPCTYPKYRKRMARLALKKEDKELLELMVRVILMRFLFTKSGTGIKSTQLWVTGV